MSLEEAERALIDQGHYSNIRVAEVLPGDTKVSIVAGPIPWLRIALFDLIFAAFGWGMLALFDALPNPSVSRPTAAALILGLMGLVIVLFTALVIWMYRHQHRAGPWAIFDATTRTITLPREDLALEASQVRGLQLIHAWPIRPRGHSRSPLTELNLLTTEEGQPLRRPLLRASTGKNCFDDILKAVAALNLIDIVRVTGSTSGKATVRWQRHDPTP